MMNAFVFGRTTRGLAIPAYKFGSRGPRVLILGGVHGDETEGTTAAFGLLERFAQSFPFQLQLTLVPAFNLDGVIHRTRQNARGVDLNRNLPSRDWTIEVKEPRYYPGTSPNSESENQALVSFLFEEQPAMILSLHSWKPMLNINGDCRTFAEAIAKHTGYIIEESIGYPTPGCLGTYAGLEHEMPTVTYEIERGLDPAEIIRVHVPAIIEGLKELERKGTC
jgi:protein MpaA